jgi:uncharacterized membrane protein YciS (DUF1049 family)
MLTLILVAGVRGHAEFDLANMLTWIFAGGFVALLVALGWLYWRMEVRRRSPVDRANLTRLSPTRVILLRLRRQQTFVAPKDYRPRAWLMRCPTDSE